jgi:sugar phosphate isomerase/epimerase
MRIGTTSFIYPGGWLYNVERLGPHFDDVELLFFESEGAHAFPSSAECHALARAKRELGLSFSLHTPLDASLASEDEQKRRAGVRAISRAIEAAATFEPEAYVLHVYLGDAEHAERPPTDIEGWRARATESLLEIIAQGIPARRLCVEQLDYDFSLIEPVIEALDLSIALDVGHLVRDGQDELAALERYLPRTRIVQWHGTDPEDRDHRSLVHYPASRARSLLSALLEANYDGVLTLEVFREADLQSSQAVVSKLLEELTSSDASRARLGEPRA